MLYVWLGWRHDGRRLSVCVPPLRHCSHPCYLVPDLESPLTLSAVLPRLEEMPTQTEVITNRTEGGQEALDVSC